MPSERPMTGTEQTLEELTFAEIVEVAREEVVDVNGEGDWQNVDVRLTFEDEHGFVWTWYRDLEDDGLRADGGVEQTGTERHKLNTPHGSVMSVPASDEEHAKKLAASEYEDLEESDFEVADTCEHGKALRSSCLRCGRQWGEKA